MSSVGFLVTGFGGRGGMAGTSFFAASLLRTGASFVDRGGSGGGFEGDATNTKSPVATGVISALGRPSLRKSEAGTGGGARRFGSWDPLPTELTEWVELERGGNGGGRMERASSDTANGLAFGLLSLEMGGAGGFGDVDGVGASDTEVNSFTSDLTPP